MARENRSHHSLLRQTNRSLPIIQSITDRPATPNLSDLPEPEKLKSLAGEIRQHTLDHLDHYLQLMQQSLTGNQGIFYLASSALEANQYLVKTLAAHRCQRICREPSVLCDEIGYDRESHIDDPDALVTGANFGIADTGQVCICRNTARTSAIPHVLICVIGIESIVPRLSDLAVMLKLLGRSSLGQPMTVSTEILGPQSAKSFHVIFVDNGRGKILGGEHRAALRCIGCGACSTVCPVYQEIRREHTPNHASPITAILSCLMKGVREFDQLPFASTLCGACSEVCPVGIDIPWHLQSLREQLISQEKGGLIDRLSHRLRAWVRKSPSRFRQIGSTRWRRSVPADALTPPAVTSFREIWKARKV